MSYQFNQSMAMAVGVIPDLIVDKATGKGPVEIIPLMESEARGRIKEILGTDSLPLKDKR